MKLDAAGSALLYATYLGGNGKDIAGVLALDPSGNAYIAGSCYGGGFPITQGAYSAYYPSGAGSVPFVAKIDTTGSPGPPELNPSVLNAARSMTA